MQPADSRPRRPFSITLLAEGFLLCALAGGLRAYGALQEWNLLLELGVQPGPVYFLLGGLFWLGTGLICGLGLLTGWYHSDRLAQLGLVLLLVSFWGDRILSSRVGMPQPNTIFAAAVSAAALLFATFALSRPSARRFLRRTGRPRWSYGRRPGN